MLHRFSRTAEWQILILGSFIAGILIYLSSKSESSVQDYSNRTIEVNETFQALQSVSKLLIYTQQLGHSEKMFILTGKLNDLNPQISAKSGFEVEFLILKKYLTKKSRNLNSLLKLESILQKRTELSDRIILERESKGRVQALQLLFERKDRAIDKEVLTLIETLNKEIESNLENLSQSQNISKVKSIGLSRKFLFFSLFAVIFLIGTILLNLRHRKRMEEKIEAISNSRIQFLTNMSHEIRTPLNSIIGLSDVLLEEKTLSHDHRQYVNTICKAGGNLLVLINDILDLAKVESGEMKFEKISFNIKSIANDTLEIVKTKAQPKGLKLVLDSDDIKVENLIGDPYRIQQVLLNLLSNAIKFTDSGEITVSLRYTKEQLLVSVKDSGIGIAPEKLSTVFNAFSQAELSTTRKYGGTGLGLSICQKLVTLMGGQIEVQSQLGQGTTFSFQLPLEPASKENFQKSSVNPTLPNFSIFKNKTILVVDDSEDNRNLLQLYLHDRDCNILFAENGQQAVDTVMSAQVDLILMDMQMPVLNGFEATQQIRKFEASENKKKTTIIALTASAMYEEKESCHKAGCDDFLSKPILKTLLIKTLDTHLSNDNMKNVS